MEKINTISRERRSHYNILDFTIKGILEGKIILCQYKMESPLPGHESALILTQENGKYITQLASKAPGGIWEFTYKKEYTNLDPAVKDLENRIRESWRNNL